MSIFFPISAFYCLNVYFFLQLVSYKTWNFFPPQVFYYLSELNDSLSYALGAGSLFDVSEDSDYVHTLLGKSYHLSLYFNHEIDSNILNGCNIFKLN